MRSLLWKEWHEQRWKLAYGSLILAAFAFIGLRARVIADEQLIQWVCFLAIALLPILASTGLIPAERDDGTLETLLSLPVDSWRIFLVKTVMGVLLASGPLLVTGAVSLAVAGGREMSAAEMAGFYLRTLATALTLFFWMFALTVRLPNETRASLITLALLIMALLVTLGILQLPGDARMHSLAWLFSPFVFLIQRVDVGAGLQWGAVLVQSAFALLLWFWAARQFPRPTDVEGKTVNQLKPLLWKEWAEIRVFFAVALFVFLGLPLLGGLEELLQHGRFDIFASMWVYYLGGILAVFVGVGTVVRDLNGRLEDFWRSRPVPIGQWLLTKYFVGLIVVLLTLSLPLIVELTVNVTHTDMVIPAPIILAWHPFTWAALYSVAFLFACLLRRGAHAAMLALAAALLLYFLPQIIPPLRHLGLDWVTEESRFPRYAGNGTLLPIYHKIPWVLGSAVFRFQQLQFAGGMLLFCVIALVLSLVAVRRDWRVESGRKMIYWSIGGALLIVFTSASFQVATNLTLLQTIDLPQADEHVAEIFSGPDRGVIITRRWIPLGNDRTQTFVTAYPFQIKPEGIRLASGVDVPDVYWGRGFWRPQTPDVLYAPSYHFEPQRIDDPTVHDTYPELIVIDLAGPARRARILSFKELTSTDWGSGMLGYFHGKLYFVAGPHLMTFDVADPANPRLIDHRRIPVSRSFGNLPFNDNPDVESFRIFLPQVPELSPRERLAVRTVDWATFDGETWTRANSERVTVYRLDELDADSARFRQAGRYDFTPVQRLFGATGWNLAATRGFVYQSSPSDNRIGTGTRLAVFDVRDPARPKPAAHFALPHVSGALYPHPLEDGRILAGGQGHLYLLSPPPKHD